MSGADVSRGLGVEYDGIVEVDSKRPQGFVGDLFGYFRRTNRPGRCGVSALSEEQYEALIESDM